MTKLYLEEEIEETSYWIISTTYGNDIKIIYNVTE